VHAQTTAEWLFARKTPGNYRYEQRQVAERPDQGHQEILTREHLLQILSEQARKGSISATIALARELRLDPGEEDEEPDVFAELDAFKPTRSRS
jgi:hypothetical protein